MASISPVQLTIAPNVHSAGMALVNVVYGVMATGDDLAAEQRYQEVAQLVSRGHRVGEPGLEHAVPFEGLPNGVIEFSSSTIYFPRSIEKEVPLADLVRGTSPLQPEPLLVRVTLTPLSPARDSNVVQLPPVQVG